ncbi:MAG: tRNA (N(6)-L-threonylcarbamoyladenosine(37)-C(2))-methylthiotransferase MtaB [Desulfobulbaceae bacterium A2]|nr:MAG: tRNA (N(6)-L-threonylcarbamoyladenosine(37)-C(2))-methylthiotransferase MtaB [Desulfobulbaceae bacterium A2]
MTTTVALATLGCKVNQYESAAISGDFEAAGCRLTPFSGAADIYVINTCAVTGRAEQESRRLIRRALRMNPQARVLVTGCYAQADPAAVRGVDPRIELLGNASKHLLAGLALAEGPGNLSGEPGEIRRQAAPCPLVVHRFPGRTRGLLKVQDGCDNFCAYCIVPYVRGRSRSVPLAQVLRQAELLAAAGYRELVVTGINVGKYGRDLPGHPDVSGLLRRLCRDFPSLRLRLSSIEPPEVSDDLLAMAAGHANFMPHFHLPLQSGDEGVLRAMRRRYGGGVFAAVVRRCRQALPDAALGADVLVGFPGEDQEAFARTHDLLASLPLSSLHVFPYSARPGTLAAAMTDQVPLPVREERAAVLRALDIRLRRDFIGSQLGRIRPVLLESRAAGPGLLRGHSDNYLAVTLAAPARLLGQVVDVRLEGPDGAGGVRGRLVADSRQRHEKG